MPENVSCTVNTCTYWRENNVCAAEKILIAIDEALHRLDEKMEIAELEATPATQSAQTSCKTFRPRANGTASREPGSLRGRLIRSLASNSK